MINIVKPYKSDMIIPISVYADTDGQINIDVYEDYHDIALQYISLFKGEYFSKAALEFINDKISPVGYVRYDDMYEYYHVYSLTDADTSAHIDTSRVQDIYRVDRYIDNTEFEVDTIIENRQPASVIMDGLHIASIASVNYFIDDEDEVELAVETLESYKGKGYGKAVLAHLSRKIADMGKLPTYRVSCFNVASIATVESCGFSRTGNEYYLNYYKED